MPKEPRFPAASKKRGMARAIEIVEWMAEYAKARQAECQPGSLLESVYQQQAVDYEFVAKTLKLEAR